MIYNKIPSAWPGRKINVGVYKDNKLLIVARELRVGDYCELKPTNKLYMCCMTVPSDTVDISTIFHPEYKRSSFSHDDTDYIDMEFSPLVQIDLTNYPNGVDIDVTEVEVSGQINFIPKAHN